MFNCKGSGIGDTEDTEDKEDKGNITPLTLLTLLTLHPYGKPRKARLHTPPTSPSPIILAY
ncbi:hypothetical protein CEN50_03085 [Fischerella thermalis CCMEE 5268]|uniref:Uncharacterized protein n=1 Tax=Fischerella thermalis CCMEE 5268 TaxID=2019662 RepID=A0A2N6KL19_9CYAN|nr:hypothetical protein CEN50_03085 [Fischerella thermalis CCMEE 5268]